MLRSAVTLFFFPFFFWVLWAPYPLPWSPCVWYVEDDARAGGGREDHRRRPHRRVACGQKVGRVRCKSSSPRGSARGSGLDRSASWRVPAFVPPSGGLYGSAPAHYAEQPENPRRRQAGGAGVGLRAVGRRGDSTGRRSARADRANCPASVLVSECRLGTPASD